MLIKGKKALSACNQTRDDRVVPMQQQVVVQLLIDIAMGDATDLGKITDHAALIQRFGRNGNGRLDAMAMKVATLAGMLHQAVAVAKIDIFGDRKHESFERKTDASGATNDTLDRAREKKPAERLWVTGLNLQVNHQRRHHPGDALNV